MVRVVDAQLGLILDAISASDVLRGNTWIVLSADHGGAAGHCDASLAANFTLPFIIWEPDLPA